MSYILTTEEIRHDYIDACTQTYDTSRSENEEIFDSWLAEHDRELSERVWQDAFAKGARRNIDGNPYRQGETE